MRSRVDHHNRVGGDFRVVSLDPVLVCLVEVVLHCLFNDHRLRKRRRMRLRMRRRGVGESFRGRTFDGKEKLR